MIVFKKYYVDTTDVVDCVPITHEVHYAIRDAGIVQGTVTVAVPAPEASLLVGEAVPAVREALLQAAARWTAELPSDGAKDAKQRPVNVAARVQSALLGRSVTLPFDQGRVLLDPYSDVLLLDFELKRQRREVVMTVCGDAPAEPAGPPGVA